MNLNMNSKIRVLFLFYLIILSGEARKLLSNESEISEDDQKNMIDVNTEKPTITNIRCEVCKSCNVKLNFSNMNFESISAGFISSPHVKTLILRNNNLKKFEFGTFNSMTDLEYLDLSQNKLDVQTYFSFGYQSSLKSLLLDYNCGYEVCITPPEKASLTTTTTTTTTEYYYSYNNGYNSGRRIFNTTPQPKIEKQLKNYDILFNYPNLNYLSMRKLNINNIVGNLSSFFPNLNYLDFSENDLGNNIAQVLINIPNAVKTLKIVQTGLINMKIELLQNVEELNVDKNNFETLSSHSCGDSTFCLQNYHKLKKLTVSKCSIKKIETDAFKDVSDLVLLDISDNEILEIANETFDYIPSLQYLNLSRNYLKSMPDVGVLKSLEQLVMDEMKYVSVFDSFDVLQSIKSLKSLSLRGNNILHVPQEFLNKLPALEELDLSGNMLTNLPVWQSQGYLQKLDLSLNAISDLQDLPMEHFESLKTFNLKNNPFSIIKMRYLKNLPDDVSIILD